jgi:Heterokaryon incompatibility protein (HET)
MIEKEFFGYSTSGRLMSPIMIHKSFGELDVCAKKCLTCRVFRQAILLNQPTVDGITSQGTDPVWVAVTQPHERDFITGSDKLLVSLQASGVFTHSHISSTIELTWDKIRRDTHNNESRLTRPTSASIISAAATEQSLWGEVAKDYGRPPVDPVWSPLAQTTEDDIYEQVRLWVEDCRGHPECGNLNRSTKNPTRLIHIVSDSEVQLLNTREMELIDYSALSYCWGGQASGRTLRENAERRASYLQIRNLPQTIQDAITLTKGVGLRYIWVDSVCIVQDNAEDWARESALMQEVYSNASFTICASSAAKADAGLFGERTAWKYPAKPCKFGSFWVSILEFPFNDVVNRSTWSSRAWTLQEERLSPRLLYWTPQ